MKNIFKKVSIILVALLALGTMSYASTPLAINGQGVDSSLQTQNNLQPSSSSSITRTTTQPTTQSGIVEQPAGQTSGSTTISVSYTHLTLPTTARRCRSRWSPYH